MANDSNLIEFSLFDDSTKSETTDSPNESATPQSASIDKTSELHIDAIIANAMRKGVSPQTKLLITQYWKPCLIQIANEHGTSGFTWRDSIKKLTNLTLYLEPEVSKSYPQVSAKLLPDLLNDMQQTIVKNNVADAGLAVVLDGLQGKSSMLDTPADTLNTFATQTADISEISHDDDKSFADSSLDLDVGGETEIPEFELDDADSFDFDLSDELAVDQEKEVGNTLSFDLPDEPIVKKVEDTQKSEKVSKPQPISFDDELPPLDLEPFKEDK
jgi:hypothetical protein